MVEINFSNRTLYHSDNLPVLQGMNSGTVHLIATDPPFNKGRDFHATPDSLAKGARFTDRWKWDRDVHEEWVDSIQDNWPAVHSVIESAKVVYGEDMAAFLCFMAVRLMEMHRILRNDGSIYLHCDHTAHAYLKTLMDAVFGKRNFRDTIIWHRAAENLSRKKWRRAAETLLYYVKGKTWTWNPQFFPLDQEQVQRDYRHEDDKGRYTTTSCTNNADRPNMVYEFNGNVRQWRYSKETMAKLDSEGLLVYNAKGIPRRKRYLSDVPGRRMTNVWSDINVLTSNDKERTGYPTQKPLALYERFIKASSNEGDIVLDPFAGCATTQVAAERLGRRWVGIDIWEDAYKTTIDRLDVEVQAGMAWGESVKYETSPPPRTDANEIPVPNLKLRISRPKERWELVTNRGIRHILETAQEVDGLIGCAGCGRRLETEFMELDHIQPKAENGADHMVNRILLCRPCNGRKRDGLTMRGLVRENKKVGWMQNEKLAEGIRDNALLRTQYIRNHWEDFEDELREYMGRR